MRFPTFPINWLSGILVLVREGDFVRRSGKEPIFSNYLLLSVKNGKLTGERKFDSKEFEIFKDMQFQA
jgi:hypothetical protein